MWEWTIIHEEQLTDNVSHADSDQLEGDNGGTDKVDRMSSVGWISAI